MFVVYALLCSDGTVHTGITKNLTKRLKYHSDKKNIENYTFERQPTKLIFERSFSTVLEALNFQEILRKSTLVEILNPLFASNVKIQEKQNSNQPLEQNTLILPSAYFGNLAYLSTLQNCSTILIDGNELFQKQTIRSRTTILSANGIQNLVVPVIRPFGKSTRTKDVLISYAENWQKDHLKAIESAYGKSSFYEFYAEEFNRLFSTRYDRLIDLNSAILKFVLASFELESAIEIAPSGLDSSIESKQLMNGKIEHKVSKPYYQIFTNQGDFKNNLSVLDLLFNEGKYGVNYVI
jgi:predicted GIY-YIG superfamily endonuclease